MDYSGSKQESIAIKLAYSLPAAYVHEIVKILF